MNAHAETQTSEARVSPDAPPSPVTFADIKSAAEVLHGVANRTPIISSRTLNERTGARAVYLKCENFQRVGAFKFRGAFNAISRLSAAERAKGVLTYSSGNHAQAVALAGAILGVRTVIIMPDDAPAVKLQATRGYIAKGDLRSEVVTYDRRQISREQLGAQIAREQGLTIIPPYDHPNVIAGQGTAAKELIEELAGLGTCPDVLLVCVGGGGLLSGCAIASRALAPSCRVIGVEPALADDAARSFKLRTLQSVKDPPTIADGARTPSLGRWTFPLVLANVDGFCTVSESEIARAMFFCIERLKLVVEPTGALGLAGLFQLARTDPNAIRGKTVGVILSGGNIDFDAIPSLRRLAESEA